MGSLATSHPVAELVVVELGCSLLVVASGREDSGEVASDPGDLERLGSEIAEAGLHCSELCFAAEVERLAS